MGVGTESLVFVKLYHLSLFYCLPKQSGFLAHRACIHGTAHYSLGSITMVILNYMNNRFMKYILVNFMDFLPATQVKRVTKYRNLTGDNTITQQLVDHWKTDR